MSSMFTPDAGGAGAAEATAAPAEATAPAVETTAATEAPAWDGPDFIAEKFRSHENPLEAQARSYAEAQKALARKTDDLRAELTEQLRPELETSIRNELRGQAPEAPDAYAYPEGVEPPAIDGLDAGFREWAHKKGLDQESFNELVGLYNRTLPDPEVERGKLGDSADEIISRVSRIGTKAIPKDLHDAAMKLATTAEGVRLLDHLLSSGQNRASPPIPGAQSASPATAESIQQRMMQIRSQPNWTKNPALIAEDANLAQALVKARQRA